MRPVPMSSTSASASSLETSAERKRFDATEPARRPPDLSASCRLPMAIWASGARPKNSAVSSETHSSRSEEHTSELQSPDHLVCRLLLEKKKKIRTKRMLDRRSTPLHNV